MLRSIVLWTVAPTLVAALNARRLGAALLAASGVNVAVNLVLNMVMGYLFGVVGIALATTGVSVVMVIYLARRLARDEPTLSLGSLNRTFLKALVAISPSALVFGIPIWAGVVQGDTAFRLVVLAVVGVAGLSSYVVIARWIGLRQAAAIVAFGKDSLRRILARVGFGRRLSR